MECLLFPVFSLWLIFSVLVGVYANNKGLFGLWYILVSLILSPAVGFLVVLTADPNVRKIEADKLRSGGNKKCPFCAELIKFEANVCRYCGRDLPLIASLSESAPTTSSVPPTRSTPLPRSPKVEPTFTKPTTVRSNEGHIFKDTLKDAYKSLRQWFIISRTAVVDKWRQMRPHTQQFWKRYWEAIGKIGGKKP